MTKYLLIARFCSACTDTTNAAAAGHSLSRASTMQEASATDIDPDLLCIKTTVLSIEDPAASKTGSMKGWMTQEDWGAELHKIDAEAYPVLRIGVDGVLQFRKFVAFVETKSNSLKATEFTQASHVLLTAVANTTCLYALVAQIGILLGALSADPCPLWHPPLLTRCICACRFVLQHVINELRHFPQKAHALAAQDYIGRWR